jgi:hypothetical protein
MPLVVVNDAILMCNAGDAVSSLTATYTQYVEFSSACELVATVFDSVEGLNVKPFGKCKLMHKKPCRPHTPVPWSPGLSVVMAAGNPMLVEGDVLPCAVGGLIQIVYPGQSTLLAEDALPPPEPSTLIDGVPVPPGVSVDQNIQDAQSAFSGGIMNPAESLIHLAWWVNKVREGGAWDYKGQGTQYQDFGNFNYGATGKAIGIPDGVLLRAAGVVQELQNTSRSSFGNPLGGPPYGDDPVDQKYIRDGIEYYEKYAQKRAKRQGDWSPFIIA